MSLSKIQKQRRIQMVEFLDELPPAEFNIGYIIASKEQSPFRPNEAPCGTIACAIGWTPRLFPETVKWNTFGNVHLRNSEDTLVSYATVASKLFGLSDCRNADVFDVDRNEKAAAVRGHRCGFDATPQQMADRLRAFWKLPSRKNTSQVPGKLSR